jgi:hypothetical protein
MPYFLKKYELSHDPHDDGKYGHPEASPNRTQVLVFAILYLPAM